jgi:hypothetical protein
MKSQDVCAEGWHMSLCAVYVASLRVANRFVKRALPVRGAQTEGNSSTRYGWKMDFQEIWFCFCTHFFMFIQTLLKK